MSPVWSMSSVHSSALELPLRHSMDRTTGDFGSRVGESEFGCARSMVIGNSVGSALGGERGLLYI